MMEKLLSHPWAIAILFFVMAYTATACNVVDSLGIEQRERMVERVAETWCGLSGEEQTALAERRQYSDAFQEYLDSRCD